jgi:predicted nuclease of predicted toxin-antitoxin system
MKLYLDEDIASQHLSKALRKAGHDAMAPGDVGQLGKSDPLQLTFAVGDERILVTGNQRDLEDLHHLIVACRGSHPGILTVRKDNDRLRDMKPGKIVSAIRNLEAVIASLRNHVICLNDWQ